MNLIERVKNILITPKTEWEVVNNETATPGSLLAGYVLPLAVIGAIGPLLGGLLFTGMFGLSIFLATAVVVLVVSMLAFFITTYIVDLLAPSFGSEKNLGKSAQLVAYSSTPSYIASFLSFIPFISLLFSLAGWAYGIYLMYLGIGTIKKTPEDKKALYMIVAYVINIAVYLILYAILIGIVFSILGLGALSLLRH
jgi:hypothetical protein